MVRRARFLWAIVLVLALGVAHAAPGEATPQIEARLNSAVRDKALEDKLAASSGIQALQLVDENGPRLLYQDAAYTRSLMEEGLARAGDVEAPELRASILQVVGVAFQFEGRFDEALAAFEQSIPFARAGSDPIQLLRAYGNIGNNHQESQRYGEALKAYQAAVRVGTPLDNSEMLGRLMLNIGTVFGAAEMSGRAIEYYEKAEKLATNPMTTRQARLNLSEALMMRGRVEEADAAMERVERDGTDGLNRYERGEYLAAKSSLELKRDPLSAIKYASEAESIFDALGSPKLAARARCIQVEAHAHAGNMQEAEDLLERCSKGTQETSRTDSGARVHLALAEIYAASGEHEKAVHHFQVGVKIWSELSQSVMIMREELAFADVQVALQQEQASLEQQRAQVAMLTADRRRLQGYAASGFGILATAIAVLLFIVFRTRVFSVAVLERSIQDREMLLAEINHRVKNNLQIVASLLGLERRRMSEEDDERSGMRDMQARILSMASIHEGLQEVTHGDHIELDEYLSRLANRLNSLYAPEYPVNFEMTISPTISMEKAASIGLIVCELVSNASKHAYNEEGPIQISLNEGGRAHEVVACVEDSGKGLPKDFGLSNAQSLGLTLVWDLAAQIGARLEAGNKPDGGARFCLKFEPDTEDTLAAS